MGTTTTVDRGGLCGPFANTRPSPQPEGKIWATAAGVGVGAALRNAIRSLLRRGAARLTGKVCSRWLAAVGPVEFFQVKIRLRRLHDVGAVDVFGDMRRAKPDIILNAGKNDKGEPLDLTAVWTALMVPENGQWKIRELTSFPKPPAPPQQASK